MINIIKITLILPLLALAGCATAPLNEDSITPLITLGVANAIQFGVPKAEQIQVANEVIAAGDLYNSLAGPNGIPTPQQFSVALNKYLPENNTKALSITELVAVYSVYYPDFKGQAPADQLAYLAKFLNAARAGASPFVTAP